MNSPKKVYAVRTKSDSGQMRHGFLFFLDIVVYISLRLIRKFVFSSRFLVKRGHMLPFYSANANQISAVPIVDRYYKLCDQVGISLSDSTVLEVGVGETNSTGYEFMARGICDYYGYEPVLELRSALDQRKMDEVIERYPATARDKTLNVRRIRSLRPVKDGSVDVILSHCVLEHVTDMDSLLNQFKRVLRDDGCMIHYVDYRDHFFRYPYHFLLFSKHFWARFLDPGYLPRHRVSDHIECLSKHGFEVDVLNRMAEEETFKQIEERIHPGFNGYKRSDLMTTFATLYVRNPS